jgi:hypothetical protein
MADELPKSRSERRRRGSSADVKALAELPPRQ